MPQASHHQVLDRCLARASEAAEKLDRLSSSKCGNAGGHPPQAELVTRPQATQASQILERCQARASEAAEKLDRLSSSQCGNPVSARVLSTNQGRESGVQLDGMLARASALLRKLDNLTPRVSGTGEPGLVPIASLTAPTIEVVAATGIPPKLVGSPNERQVGGRGEDGNSHQEPEVGQSARQIAL